MVRKTDEPMEWVKSMVVVEILTGRLGTFLDPRNSNRAIKREYYDLPTFDEIASSLTGTKLFAKLYVHKEYWQIPLDEESIRSTSFYTQIGRYQFTCCSTLITRSFLQKD